MAVRKRTMDSAPTIPRDSTTLLTTVMIRIVVISARAIRVVPKLAEYITLLQLFLYTKKINKPMRNARTRAMAISRTEIPVIFSRKFDLKIS